MGTAIELYPQKQGTALNGFEVWLRAKIRPAAAVRLSHKARLDGFLRATRRAASSLAALPDSALAARLDQLRLSLAQRDFADAVVAESFAMIREWSTRRLQLTHFDTQLAVGWVMLNGMIAEMETGEGKTLAATLAAGTAALAGIPVHVVTVNPYLARRDADLTRPLYQALGLSVGVATEGMEPHERRSAYRCDITYCTNKQLTFDYLRDRLHMGDDTGPLSMPLNQWNANDSNRLFLRGLHFAIVDEADSVFIDEARSPLIIAKIHDDAAQQATYRQAITLARVLRLNHDFVLDRQGKGITLTENGRSQIAQTTAYLNGVWSGRKRREHLVLSALTALHAYHRDRDYLVSDGKVKIIDEHTGRLKVDSSWELGLHQMIECKEDCPLTGQNEVLARMTYQTFFTRYLRLAGMTGTAREIRREVQRCYGLDALAIQPQKPSRRSNAGVRLYPDKTAQMEALLSRLRELQSEGRPVLVGTRSVSASEQLSERLTQAGIQHQLLNARQDHQEAEMIANAGMPGQITLATNMAGRGTDIKLAEEIESIGGLHVVATELNDSGRVDRQLYGRCGRQGQPGSYEWLLSLEDSVIAEHFPKKFLHLLQRLCSPYKSLPLWLARGLVYLAQQAREKHHYRVRQSLLAQERQMKNMLAFTGKPE